MCTNKCFWSPSGFIVLGSRNDSCHLRAVGSEDLINLCLCVGLRDALLGSNGLGQGVSVASGGLEVVRGELWELSSESGSGFFDTHVDVKVVWTVQVC